MALLNYWVWAPNLNPLIEQIESMAGQALDDSLLKIFKDDIEESDTDGSPERWASCQFDGPRPITAWLGIDQGTNVLRVRLELPDSLSVRAETTLKLMQRYRFHRD